MSDNKYILIILLSLLILSFSGCSVYMAGTKEGVTIEDISKSKSRAEVIYKDDVEIVDTKRDENGNVLHEDYFLLKPQGSFARAALHGLFDVMTIGLWEIIGTPVEQHMGEKVYVPVRIYYGENSEINKVEYLKYD